MTKNCFYPLCLLPLALTSCFGAQQLQSPQPQNTSSWQITIEDPLKETLRIDATPEWLVMDVKKSIYAQRKVPIKLQKLLFEGETLDDNEKLLVYDIEKGDTLILRSTKQAGDHTFSFASFKSYKDIKAIKNSESEKESDLFTAYGLNLIGFCKSNKCGYKEVAIPQYYGTFYFPNIIESYEEIALCPHCNEFVEGIATLGFSYCTYKIVGMKKGLSNNGNVKKERFSIKDKHTSKQGMRRFFASGKNTKDDYYAFKIIVEKFQPKGVEEEELKTAYI